jgi:glycosyltransferase involved in cell wall biosynthesis
MARSVTLLAREEPTVTGTSRYAQMLAVELGILGWGAELATSRPSWPTWVGRLGRRLGVDPAAFWTSYPLAMPRGAGTVLHLTSQTLATSLLTRRPTRPTVVTVHDVLPYELRADPQMSGLRHPIDLAFYRLALRGLRRASLILADSVYTAAALRRHTRIDGKLIRVVPLGVDTTRFVPVEPDATLRARYGLSGDERYVVYVGSEHPRKNLGTLVEAFAAAAGRSRELRLLKVGRAHHADERARLRALAAGLGVADRVRFLDDVPERDLPALYGAASVCVIPSLYEGFGLPVLEAMACGVPVVCSNRTSLPEVAGDAALVVEPSVRALASAIEAVLGDPSQAAALRERGLRRAAEYTWRRTAESTARAYEELLAASR